MAQLDEAILLDQAAGEIYNPPDDIDAEIEALTREADDSQAVSDGLLCSIEHAKAGRYLEMDIPPRLYVIDGLLPEPVAASIVSPGGVGKSFLLLQAAASVASGVPFFGHDIRESGGVLMLTAEDDRNELARRLSAVQTMMRLNLGMTEDQEQALHYNLHMVSRLGMDSRLTRKDAGRVEWEMDKINRIIKTAQAIDNLRLIILDPVSRFRSGDENDNDESTRFAEVLEFIRNQSGITVLTAHHSRKGSTGDSQDDIRGGSAFVDALRFAATLYSPNADAAKKLGIDPEEAYQWVRYKKVKSNYPVKTEEMWFKRGQDGVLMLTTPPSSPPNKAEAKGEERYQAALPKILEMVRKADAKGEPMTARQFRPHGGAEGVFGMGVQSLIACVSRAIEEGKIQRSDDAKLRLY